MIRSACILLLAAGAVAGPITADELSLIPGLGPRERRALEARLGQLLEQGKPIADELIAAGVSPVFVRRMQAVSGGPLLLERFSHGLVFAAPFLTDKQRALLDKLVPGTDAAQLALWTHRERFLKELPGDPERQRLHDSTDRQMRDIEKRFWRVVAYVLTVEQRSAIHPLYPQAYIWPPDFVLHVYQLPGLTASQANRITALVQEYVSETAADIAESQRLQKQLQGPKLGAEERARLQQQAQDAGDRVAYLRKDIVERSASIYTAEQVLHMQALVPMVTVADRSRHPGELVQQSNLSPEQLERCHALGARLHEKFAANKKRLAQRLQSIKGEVGDEGPQATMMQGMENNKNGDNARAMEELAHEMILDVFTPDQTLAWVVSPR